MTKGHQKQKQANMLTGILSAVCRQPLGVHEGARGHGDAVVGADVVNAHARAGEGVSIPLGALGVEELQLGRPGELVV